MSQLAFRALADPTRRDILIMLQRGDMTIAQVAENFDMTRAAVKKHLIILADAGLITSRAVGRERFNSIVPQGLAPVTDWLTAFDTFWEDKLIDLKTAIERENP